MRILQIVYSLKLGGAERFVVDLCNAQASDTKNEVYLLTILDDSLYEAPNYYHDLSMNVQYRCVNAKRGGSLYTIFSICRYILRIKPDIVHLHSNLILLYLPALFLSRAKYVHTLHSLADKVIFNKRFKNFQRFLYRKRVLPVTISDLCYKSFIKYYKLDRVVNINNGRSPVKTTDKIESVKQEISTYALPDIPIFIHVARCSPEKNQQLLFQTFNELNNEGIRFLLLVLGGGFQDYIKKNMCSSIKILGPKNNVGDYLACSEFFVLSSRWEGLPISLLEAMSQGCIPISTPAGGVVDVIENGVNGYISKDVDKDSFKATIKLALKERGTITRELIKKKYFMSYTMQKCVAEYDQVYHHLCKQSKKGK